MSASESLEHSLGYKTLKLILYALLLTPLLVWSIFLFPFITTKVLYLRLLIELAVVIYVYLAFRYPEIRPSWNRLSKIVIFYFLIIIVTSLIGVNVDRSFMGTVERGEGVVTMLHYLFYFLLLPVVFRRARDWKHYLVAANLMITVVALYGLAQLMGLSFLLDPGGARISGTIGNAAFFAGFVMFGIFLSLHLLKSYSFSKLARYFFWALIIIDLLAIYNSQTRGAILALGITAIIYSIYILFRGTGKRSRLIAAAALVLILLAAVGIYSGKDSKFIQSHVTLARIATISTSDITTQSRFDVWGASWEGLKDRFFTGYGYENYNIAFNEHFPARVFKDQGSQIWFDRAHNVFFDVSVTSGIFGLLAYLGIFVTAGLFLLKFSFRQGGVVFLGLALVAYFVQNLFVFDTHATYLLFFMVLGYISYLITTTEREKDESARRKVLGYAIFPATISLVVMLFVAYFVNFEPASANVRAIDAIITVSSGRADAVKPGFTRALSLGTYMDEEIRQRLAGFANQAASLGEIPEETQKEIYQYALAEIEKSIAHAPRDARNYLFAVMLINRGRDFFPPDLLSHGRELAERALALSPTRPQIYYELGQVALAQGNIDEGLEFFQTAIDLNPEPKESHFNLLIASIFAERPEIAKQELQKLNETGYILTAEEYQSIAQSYARVENAQGVIETYQAAIAKYPKNPELYAKTAAAYGEVCDLENADRYVNEAIALNSGFAVEGKVFLQDLEKKCTQPPESSVISQ